MYGMGGEDAEPKTFIKFQFIVGIIGAKTLSPNPLINFKFVIGITKIVFTKNQAISVFSKTKKHPDAS